MFTKATKIDYQNIADFINTYINPQFSAVLDEEEKEYLVSCENESTMIESVESWYVWYVCYDNDWILQATASVRKKDQKVIYLWHFYVRTDNQRIWLWSLLLEEIESMVKNDWYDYILLETQKKFFWAVNFYFKRWYKELNNENISQTYFKKFYNRLVDPSIMFYKVLK